MRLASFLPTPIALPASSIRPPKLTFPPPVAKLVREFYGRAGAILEYGSGGSTALAADMDGKSVWSVESDAKWLAGLRDWFAANPPRANLSFLHADVGPTARWGWPADDANWRNFHRYPLAVWDEPGFVQPDVVLIDGRFRAACFLAVLFRTARPVNVLIDDYKNRAIYHVVEHFAKPVEIIGRMARFELEPRQIDGPDLMGIMRIFGEKK